MVTLVTTGRPVVAYIAILSGNISAAFVTYGIGDDIAAIVGLVLSVIFIGVTLGLMGVAIFREIRPRFMDFLLFLNAADFAGVAALVGSHLWLRHFDKWTALGAIFAYAGLSIVCTSIWIGLRAAERAR